MTEHNSHDDPSLRNLLRAHTPAPPLDEVDWSALHVRTTARAAPLLRRRAATWWQILGSRSSHPLRAAAAAAIVLLVAAGMLMPERPATASHETDFRTVEEELALGLPYGSVPLLAAQADNGDVIDALLLYDGEQW